MLNFENLIIITIIIDGDGLIIEYSRNQPRVHISPK